jgi:hypothetical protein
MNKNIFKSIGAVIAGFIVILVLSVGTDTVLEQIGVFPRQALFDTGLLLIALAYRSVYSVIGCYLTAKLAPDRPMRHALALGSLGVAVSAAGTIAARDLGPLWYGVALVVIALPLAWLSGRLFELRSGAPESRSSFRGETH